MPTYLKTNRQPDGYRGSPDTMRAWKSWLHQLGEHLVEGGNPIFTATTAGDCGPTTRIGGYTLITADDLDHANALVATCPPPRSAAAWRSANSPSSTDPPQRPAPSLSQLPDHPMAQDPGDLQVAGASGGA